MVIRSVSRAYYHQLQLRDYKNINYSSVTTRISELQTCIPYPQPYAPGKQGPADDGKRLGLSESALSVVSLSRRQYLSRMGRGSGGGVGSRLDRAERLADDGKRLDSLSLRWTLYLRRVY